MYVMTIFIRSRHSFASEAHESPADTLFVDIGSVVAMAVIVIVGSVIAMAVIVTAGSVVTVAVIVAVGTSVDTEAFPARLTELVWMPPK